MREVIRQSTDVKQIVQLGSEEKRICAILNTYNQLRPYKLDAVEVLEWKDSIIKLVKDLDIDALEFLVDKMIAGEMDYDRDKGIQNIFLGLKKVEKTETGYKILRSIW
jgi:hypothetical protein